MELARGTRRATAREELRQPGLLVEATQCRSWRLVSAFESCWMSSALPALRRFCRRCLRQAHLFPFDWDQAEVHLARADGRLHCHCEATVSVACGALVALELWARMARTTAIAMRLATARTAALSTTAAVAPAFQRREAAAATL